MKIRSLLLVAVGCLMGIPLAAQKRMPYAFAYQGLPLKESQLSVLTEVNQPSSSFLRLYFKGTQLGETSYLLLEGTNGARQELRTADLQHWNFSSAYFNGGTVKVSLFAAAGEKNVVRVSELKVTDEQAERARNARQAAGTLGTAPPPAASTSANLTATYPYAKAVGRFTNGSSSFGTGWIAPNGAIVTNWRIYNDFYTHNGYDVIEFNVPPSVGGTVMHPSPQDQYPLKNRNQVVMVSLIFKDVPTATGYPISAGWLIVEPLPNGTGLRPGERQQEYFRIATNPSNYIIDAIGDVPVDIFHYGNAAGDDLPGGTTYRTLQLMQTSLLKQNDYLSVFTSDRDRFVLYNTPAFLGSDEGAPITYEGSNVAIGVHNGSNTTTPEFAIRGFGLGFRDDAFRNAVSDFYASNSVYVDPDGLYDPGTGEIHKPFRTENKAANDAPAGAQVYFARGEYYGPSTFSRPMTLRAPVGKVTMGVPFSSARNAARPTIPPQLLAEGPSPSFDRESAEERRVGASPNPFRDGVTVSYQLATKGPVSVAVFNGGGAEVARLVSGEAEAGSHTVRWGGTDHTGALVPPGLYIVRVNSGNQTFTTKLLKQ